VPKASVIATLVQAVPVAAAGREGRAQAASAA
jgi:hypothetical protein